MTIKIINNMYFHLKQSGKSTYSYKGDNPFIMIYVTAKNIADTSICISGNRLFLSAVSFLIIVALSVFSSYVMTLYIE